MSVYKIFAAADATLYSAYKNQNAGLDEILEIACKNAVIPSAVLSTNSADDIRRAVIQFSDSDLQYASNLVSGSTWSSNLRLFFATAENLNMDYNIEVYQVSQSWAMGTGKFLDTPPSQNGVCWNNTGSYIDGVTDWASPQYYNTPGGGTWTTTTSSLQNFGYKDNKDLNVDVTGIVNNWLFNEDPNFGFIAKLPLAVEQDSGSYIALDFFSIDTHTIYPPTLEIKWDDSTYNTGSLSIVSNNSTILTIGNNPSVFKNDTAKYTFRINARDQYPIRAFITSSVYTVNKALPSTSFWAIQDVKTEEMIIDFDSSFTKISCDSNGSYFPVYMNGLEPERFYKILIKINLPTGESIDVDNNNIFKITR